MTNQQTDKTTDSSGYTPEAGGHLPSEALTIEHITITPKGDRIDASCSICHMGIDIGEKFGFIPGEVMLTEWIKQHVHKPKTKRAKAVPVSEGSTK